MANLNFPYSSAPARTVQEIRFGIFSAKESERLAVIDIEYPETTYVNSDHDTPVPRLSQCKSDANAATGMSSV